VIYFGVPLQSKAVSNDWMTVTSFFNRTLSSIYGQTDPNFRILVACHDIPNLTKEYDDRVEFLIANSPIPRTKREMMKDKGYKISMIAKRVREIGAGYIMLVDADDLISNRIAGYVNNHPGRNGFKSKYGYVFYEGTSYLKRIASPYRTCGSCSIVYYGLDDLPESLPENPWDDVYRDQWIIRKSCRELPRFLMEQGRPLKTMPFPTTVYVRNTGENHSMINGGDLSWKRKVEMFLRRKTYINHDIKTEFGF